MRDGVARMVAALAIAGTLAGGVQAAAQDQGREPTWKRALWVRSQELNRMYALGDFEPVWKRALRVRGEELNRR